MEYIIVCLLALIATSEIYRTYLGLKTPSKKEHFRRRLQNTREMIWALQFKMFKTREIREDIRQEYDMMMSRISNLEAQLNNWPKDSKDPKFNKDEKARIEDQKVLAIRDKDRMLAQMKQLDLEVEGAKPSNENPNGVDGISSNVESLRELEAMIAQYIKTL